MVDIFSKANNAMDIRISDDFVRHVFLLFCRLTSFLAILTTSMAQNKNNDAIATACKKVFFVVVQVEQRLMEHFKIRMFPN